MSSVSLGLSIALTFSACSPIRTKEQESTCRELDTYIQEISDLQNATASGMSDGSTRRAGAGLILAKLDEMQSAVTTNDSKLQPLISEWIEKQTTIASEYRKFSILDLDNQLLDKTISEFKQVNSELGNFCS